MRKKKQRIPELIFLSVCLLVSGCAKTDTDNGRELVGADDTSTIVSVSDFSEVKKETETDPIRETEIQTERKPVVVIETEEATEAPETELQTEAPSYQNDYDLSDDKVKSAILSAPLAKALIEKGYSDYVSQNTETQSRSRTFSIGDANDLIVTVYADRTSGTSNGKLEIQGKDQTLMKELLYNLGIGDSQDSVNRLFGGDYDGSSASMIGLSDVQRFISDDGTATIALTKAAFPESDNVPGWLDESDVMSGTVILPESAYTKPVNAQDVLNDVMTSTFGSGMSLKNEKITDLTSIEFDLDGNMKGGDGGYSASYEGENGTSVDIHLSDDGKYLVFDINDIAVTGDYEILAKCEHIYRMFYNCGFDLNAEIGEGYKIERAEVTITEKENKDHYQLKISVNN